MLRAYFCDVNVARTVNGDPIRRFKWSYARNESAVWREFLDAPVICVRDQNISISINSNSSRWIKLSLASSSSTFRQVSYPFARGIEIRSWRKCAYALLKLLNIPIRDVQHVKCPYSSLKGIWKRILRPEIAKRLEHSNYPFCLWITFPDQFQIFVTGRITCNGPFIRVPYILLALDNEKGILGTKRQNLAVIVIMQKQVNDWISVTLTDERFVCRIGDAFNPIELVALQVRRIGVFFTSNNML